MMGDLQKVVGRMEDKLVDVRDKALLLVGFAGALRRSELVALAVEDVEWVDGGVVVVIRQSKTDQEAAGQEIGIPYGSTPDTCPVGALKAWLEAAQITQGPIFRRVDQWGNLGINALHPGSVADIVKKRVNVLGLDPAEFAGDSLRAGLATSAAQNGASELTIMAQTRHKSSAMVKGTSGGAISSGRMRLRWPGYDALRQGRRARRDVCGLRHRRPMADPVRLGVEIMVLCDECLLAVAWVWRTKLRCEAGRAFIFEKHR
jgi:integrase